MSLPTYCNAEPWRPIDLPVSDMLLSEDDVVERILDLTHVEDAERYRPKNGMTFCNILAWDVSKAFRKEVPHWYDPATGDPTTVGKGREMNVNTMQDWLLSHGLERAWGVSSERKDAVAWAQKRYLVLALWKNKTGKPGHVAIILPDGKAAQAGTHCHRRATLETCFDGLLPQVKYFCHAR